METEFDRVKRLLYGKWEEANKNSVEKYIYTDTPAFQNGLISIFNLKQEDNKVWIEINRRNKNEKVEILSISEGYITMFDGVTFIICKKIKVTIYLFTQNKYVKMQVN